MQRLSQPVRGDWSALDAYLQDVYAQPVSSDEESTASETRTPNNSTAAERERLVLTHLRLVVRIARQYSGFGLPLSDLIAEGNVALIRAAELYDPSFGTKFHNYASVWIRQRLQRAITKQARAVRIPVWRSQRLRKLAKLNDDLSAELGHTPTEAELAERLGLSEERFAELRSDRIEVLSLDAPTDSEQSDARQWIERLADETTPAPDVTLDRSEAVDEAIASLHDLDQRELEILALKHGLHPRGEMSYRQLAPQLGVSHEWVRRIGQYALVKARRAMEAVRGLPAPVRKARADGVLARIRALAEREPVSGSCCATQ
ncbi:sigma-70 family RNA polymerase sigma factor [Verrucomicrobiota bacterium sgz303538]